METNSTYTLIGDELLTAVFHFFPKRVGKHFKVSAMEAFYKASKQTEFAELFINYGFDEDGVYPYSKEFEEGMMNLKMSQLVYESSGVNTYQFSEGISIRFDKYINPRLSDKQKGLVKKLSDEIMKIVF